MWHLLLVFPVLSYLVCSVQAQHQTFSWSIATELEECDSIPIKLAPFSVTSSFNGVGPFYMISYELGGIATTDYLGTKWQELTWTVRHPQGAQVFLNVVDSTENSGGILSGTVQGGTTNSCHPAKPRSPMKVVADLPQVATCDSVNASISGGNKPYTISVVSTTNNRSPSNFTIGKEDDVFTYVDKVAPGDSFFIAASDSTGQWAYGTNFISSVGSTDTSCPGKRSFGSQSANATQPADTTSTSTARSGASSRHLSVAAIGGLIAGSIIILLSATLVACFLIRRRHISATNRRIFPFNDDITPFIAPDGSGSMPQMRQSITPVRNSAYTIDYSNVPLLRNPRPPSRASHFVARAAAPSQSGSISNSDPDPFAAVYTNTRPISQNWISSDEGRAPLLPRGSVAEDPSNGPLRVVTSQTPIARSTKQRLADQAAHERGRPLTVFQHEDAEDLLEVPPVYRERGGPSGGS